MNQSDQSAEPKIETASVHTYLMMRHLGTENEQYVGCFTSNSKDAGWLLKDARRQSSITLLCLTTDMDIGSVYKVETVFTAVPPARKEVVRPEATEAAATEPDQPAIEG